jgi:hypothetical protein
VLCCSSTERSSTTCRRSKSPSWRFSVRTKQRTCNLRCTTDTLSATSCAFTTRMDIPTKTSPVTYCAEIVHWVTCFGILHWLVLAALDRSRKIKNFGDAGGHEYCLCERPDACPPSGDGKRYLFLVAVIVQNSGLTCLCVLVCGKRTGGSCSSSKAGTNSREGAGWREIVSQDLHVCIR